MAWWPRTPRRKTRRGADGNGTPGAAGIAEWAGRYADTDFWAGGGALGRPGAGAGAAGVGAPPGGDGSTGGSTSDGEDSEDIIGIENPEYKPKKWSENVTFKEIEDELKDLAGFEEVDLSALHTKAEAKHVYEVFNKSIVAFPELISRFKKIGYDPKIVEAKCYTETGLLLMGENFKKGLEYTKANSAFNVKIGWWAKGRKWYSSITHEIGHFIDKYLTEQYYHLEYMPNKLGNASNKIMDNVLDELGLTDNDIPEKLSKYALHTPGDFLAEAYSEFMDSNSPRPLAKAVGNALISMFKELRQ